MEYTDCFECGPTLWFDVLLIGAVVLGGFLAGRRRNWTFVGALLGVPLAVWATDEPWTALVAFVSLLIGTLSGTWYAGHRARPSSADAA
jgi:hypothetical protein